MSQVTYKIGADTTEIVAKLDEVVRAFQKVGTNAKTAEKQVSNATDSGATGSKEMAAGFDKLEAKLTEVVGVFRDFSVAANKAAKPIKDLPAKVKPATKSTKKLETGFISLKEGAEGFGGEMGAVAGRIDKFAKSAAAAGSAMGPWGMGIAAVTLGLGGLAWGLSAVTSAAVEFVDGADDMIDRLGEIAGVEAIPDRTIQQIAEFDRMMVAAETHTKRFQALIAGELAVALTDIGWAFVGVVQGLQGMAEWAGKNSEKIGAIVNVLDSLILRRTKLGALFGLFRDVGVSAVKDFADATKEANRELADLAAAKFIMFGPSPEALEEEKKRRIAVMEAIAKEDIKLFEDAQAAKKKAAEKAAKEQAAAAKERAKIAKIGEDELRKMQQESHEEMQAELDAAFKAFQENEEKKKKVAEAAAKAAKERAEMIRDVIKTSIHDALSATADLWDHFTARAMEQDQERKDKQLEILEETRGGFRDHLNKIESLEHELAHERDATRRAQLQREIDAQRDEVEAHKNANKDKRDTAKQRAREAHREMVKAFRANKAAQISGVLIDSAAAYMGFLEYFSDKTAFAPALAAALVAPATSASIAKIAAEQPPKFHDGVGAVDEMLATLRSGEAVLNQRGAQAAGGPQAIEQLNRGTPPGPTTLVFSYAGRAVERVVLDAMQRGGPLQAAMAGGPAGVLNPYGGK